MEVDVVLPGSARKSVIGSSNGQQELADTALRSGRLTDALRLQEKAVQLAPDAGPLWHQLGIVREQLGMAEEARAAFEEAIRIDPASGAYCVALARMEIALGNAGRAKSLLLHLEPSQVSDPAVVQECAGYLLEVGDVNRAFDFLQSVQLKESGAELRLAAACLAGGQTALASLYFNGATERYYYRVKAHGGLVPRDRPKVELAVAVSPWRDRTSAFEIAFEIARGRTRITFSPEFLTAERRTQVIALRRAALVAPLFWSVWPLRRRAQVFLVSVRDTGLDGHLGFCGRDTAKLIPDTQFLQSFGYAKFRDLVGKEFTPWPDRRPVVFWRGAANGFAGRKPRSYGCHFEWSPRLNLCAKGLASRYAGKMDIGITELPPPFQGDPLAERRKLERFMREPVPAIDQMQYQYLIDIDGWSNSWSGLFQKLLLGSTILKVTSRKGAKQWYYDRMVPFETHLPVKSDLSDLDDIVAWAVARPGEAARIAANGYQLGSSLMFSTEFAAAVHRIADHSNS